MLEPLELLKVMVRVLLCMLEAAEVPFRYLEVQEVQEVVRCALIYIPEVVEGGLYSLDVLEVMRQVLLSIPEAMEVDLFAGGAGRLWIGRSVC